jgi:hypothetical protein
MSKRSDPDGYSGSDMALFLLYDTAFLSKKSDPDGYSGSRSGSDMVLFLLYDTGFMSKKSYPDGYSGFRSGIRIRYGPFFAKFNKFYVKKIGFGQIFRTGSGQIWPL